MRFSSCIEKPLMSGTLTTSINARRRTPLSGPTHGDDSRIEKASRMGPIYLRATVAENTVALTLSSSGRSLITNLGE